MKAVREERAVSAGFEAARVSDTWQTPGPSMSQVPSIRILCECCCRLARACHLQGINRLSINPIDPSDGKLWLSWRKITIVSRAYEVI